MDKEEAIKVLKMGGVVIFPTDTAYGIGCRIDDEKAIERLFRLRKRSETKAVPVLVSSVEMAKEYWKSVPQEVIDKLIEPYWPGALTIILQSNIAKVPKLVRGGGETLGLRMPANKDLLDIICSVGVPILGTSANFAGEPTPYNFEDLDIELVKLVDYVLRDSSPPKADQNDNDKKTSTVIDCSVTPWKILRHGAVEISME
jgi:L-threonylcarbamoyladenylate synthase